MDPSYKQALIDALMSMGGTPIQQSQVGQQTRTPYSYGKPDNGDPFMGMTPDQARSRVMFDPTASVGPTPWDPYSLIANTTTPR